MQLNQVDFTREAGKHPPSPDLGISWHDDDRQLEEGQREAGRPVSGAELEPGCLIVNFHLNSNFFRAVSSLIVSSPVDQQEYHKNHPDGYVWGPKS